MSDSVATPTTTVYESYPEANAMILLQNLALLLHRLEQQRSTVFRVAEV
jgi:hypothetical protein